MSQSKVAQKTSSTVATKPSGFSMCEPIEDEDGTVPDFIYGGPFIPVEKPSPFLSTATPINIQLQGTFKKSFAYHSLKEKLPVILTKVIDYCSREGASIRASYSASDNDLRNFIQHVSKLKSDLVTNKPYDLFTVDTVEAKNWNNWIQSQNNSKYFTNIWLFTECYVYRKIREGCELNKTLIVFDPFEQQKTKAFAATLEMMCVVAEKMEEMLPEGDKDKRKQDFMTLLKICLWSNRCDLALTAGSELDLQSGANTLLDPFQMIIDCKDRLLVDDTGKAADQIVAKAEAVAKAIEGNTTFKYQCSCHRLATLAGLPIQEEPAVLSNSGSPARSPPPEPADEADEGPKVPCPAKMTIPQALMFDVVCDNAAYELFCDLCFAHFLISQKIVEKVRFHVKRIPWFVSDVTPKDFNFVIQACKGASFSKTVTPEPKPAAADGTEPEQEPPRTVSSAALHELATQWQQYVDDGTFIIMDDEFWTSPHPYKDMKKYAPLLYRKLQFAVGILFKGDLNYRKLMAEMNWPSTQSFDASLQGFNPAPIIAVRTVKSELICGLPKGKADLLNKTDEKWMQTGGYGVIHFSGKAEALKISDRPCEDYGEVCFGNVCPVHTDF